MQRRGFRSGMVALLFLMTAHAGCVTRGTFDEMEAERDALSNRVNTLERANGELEDELVNLRAQSVAIEDELRDEVVAGQIRIDQISDGIRVDMSNELLFSSGSAILSDTGRDVILRLAGQLRDGDQVISVEGHTDNVMIGSALETQYPSNWELAAARAARVARRLSAEGVDPTRIRVVSRGPFAPLESNDTEEGRARNRRTEILLRPVTP